MFAVPVTPFSQTVASDIKSTPTETIRITGMASVVNDWSRPYKLRKRSGNRLTNKHNYINMYYNNSKYHWYRRRNIQLEWNWNYG